MTSFAVILFDGDCTLCNRAVQFILRHDAAGLFQFAPLQSAAAQQLLQTAGLTLQALPDSIVLVEHGRVFTRSTAALRIARGLRAPWPLAYLLILVPTFLRDRAYDLVARHRYRLFGKQPTCLIPTPELQRRFLG